MSSLVGPISDLGKLLFTAYYPPSALSDKALLFAPTGSFIPLIHII